VNHEEAALTEGGGPDETSVLRRFLAREDKEHNAILLV